MEIFLLVFLSFFLLFTCFLLFIISSAFIGFVRTRVPFVPTSDADVEFLVKELGIRNQDVFYELGSGNGKVCFAVTRQTGAKTVGYELTRWTHLWAVVKSKFKNRPPVGGSKIQFKRKDFFKEDWSQATVIYGYLYPPLMSRVKEKFLNECKPGTKAIMRDFFLPNLEPNAVYKRPNDHEIYVYIK
ncbi:MAG: hypothetical protein JNN11_00980 [Candidatus Doudnabacteria bacterium]|nr:hypothetical protein [Candidatus Doudnabacteria bacterium]